MTPRPRLLSLAEAAAESGVHVRVLRRLITNGTLPTHEAPGVKRIYIDRAELNRIIDSWRRVAGFPVGRAA